MPERSTKPKRPRDLNQAAFQIVQESTDTAPPPAEKQDDGKNPAAVALGRLGGKKGGPARMQQLTPEQRSELGKKAAEARWGKKE